MSSGAVKSSNPDLIERGMAWYNEKIGEPLGLRLGVRCYNANYGWNLLSSALFIIGCIGAAGAFPGATMGWVVIGLGGGAVIMTLLDGNRKKRLWCIIPIALSVATFITLGGLNVAGILSNTQLGIALIVASIASNYICTSAGTSTLGLTAIIDIVTDTLFGTLTPRTPNPMVVVQVPTG